MRNNSLFYFCIVLLVVLTAWNTYIWFMLPISIQQQSQFESKPLNQLQAVRTDSLSKQRLDFVIEELKSYRAFVENERKAHTEFVTRVYGLGGTLAAVVIALLGYFGFKSLDDVEKRANSAYQEKVQLLLSQKLSEQEGFAETLSDVVRRQGLWRGCKILFVGEFEKTHKSDIEAFLKPQGVKYTFIDREDLTEDGFKKNDVVIVNFDPASKEELAGKVVNFDPYLRKWAPLIPNGKTPFVVFTNNGWIDDNTKNLLATYPYFTAANNRISLFANIFDAFQLAATRT